MARARTTGDSKQGLIIALVIFVILSLVLGVVAFLGYNEQGTLDAQKKDAEQKKADANKEREKLDFERLVYKHAIGIADKEDSNKLAGLRSLHQAEFDPVAKPLLYVTWAAGEAAPSNNYVALATKLFNDNKNSQNEAAALKAELDKKATEYADGLKTKNEELQKTQAALKKLAEEFAKVQQHKTKEYTDLFAEVKKCEEENAKLKNDKDEVQNARKKDLEKFETKIKDLELALVKARDRVKPVDRVALDLPKGKIVTIDRRARTTAYVDIGTADRVKPGLTFSIFKVGIDGKKEGTEPVGSLEIVNPLEDHLSQAKITETRNPTREPILEKYLLYNPAWSPNLQEHLAIAGLIDLMGDGKDHTDELIRILRKQGIIIDAYLDLKDGSVKNGDGGPGKLTRSTDYLILGEFPQFSGDTQITDNPITERKMSVHEKLSQLDKEADSLGITKIPVRRFLALIGYKAPRTAFTGDTSTFYLKPPKTSAEPKEPKEKEEPKDDTDTPKKPPKKEPPKKEPPKKEEKPVPKGGEKPAPKEDKGR